MIATIRTMRKLSPKHRMQADSIAEIRDGLDDLVDLFDRDEKVNNRPVSEGHVLQAAVLVLLGMPPEEREARLRLGVEKLKALLLLDESDKEQIAEIIAATEMPAVANEKPASKGAGEGEIDLGSGGRIKNLEYPQGAKKSAPKKARGK